MLDNSFNNCLKQTFHAERQFHFIFIFIFFFLYSFSRSPAKETIRDLWIWVIAFHLDSICTIPEIHFYSLHKRKWKSFIQKANFIGHCEKPKKDSVSTLFTFTISGRKERREKNKKPHCFHFETIVASYSDVVRTLYLINSHFRILCMCCFVVSNGHKIKYFHCEPKKKYEATNNSHHFFVCIPEILL